MADQPECDRLCGVCEEVDLYSLFTGPRYYPGDGHHYRRRVKLGTLHRIVSNQNCPLCRLVKHDVFGELPHPWATPWEEGDSPDPPDYAKIDCVLTPRRVDYHEDMKYTSDRTRALLATRVAVQLEPVPGCSEEESDRIRHYQRGSGILLLSPESVDPARPLLNGFRATTMEESFRLVKGWMQACQNSHGETCEWHGADAVGEAGKPEYIRVIDVAARRLVECDARAVEYAALSYVWGGDTEAYLRLAAELVVRGGSAGVTETFVPAKVPVVIADAMQACAQLGLPYLWADLYCVHQNDPVQKAADIDSMGHIYRHARITLVAGRYRGDKEGDVRKTHGIWRLFPASMTDDLGARQRIETVGGRQYITALPQTIRQIHSSAWHRRGWTYQEGALARRIAFFGDYDILYMCGAGHWRQAMHSGAHGHDGTMPGIDLRSKGYYTLSARHWLGSDEWRFEDYLDMVHGYTPRDLTYESDRLNAISGCLNIIAQRKGIQFLWGLPSVDFHYALLWSGENANRRPGVPSWSWTAWACLQIRTNINPRSEVSGTLTTLGDGRMVFRNPSPPEIEFEGLLISTGLEHPHRENRCAQWLADLTLSTSKKVLTISSEGARFFLDIAAADPTDEDGPEDWSNGRIPGNFDSRKAFTEPWIADTEYRTPDARLRLRDRAGNSHVYHYPRWYDHPPYLKLMLPGTLRGSTLAWLLRDGIDVIKVAEVRLVRGEPELEPFHHVFCLGIDRSEGLGEDSAYRLGMFCLPKEVWDMAAPSPMTVELA